MLSMEAFKSHQRAARTAGLLYLIVVLAGIFSIAYVPSRLIVPGDAAATVHQIKAAEPLFRLGIAAGVVCYTAFLLLPLALYRLLSPVSKGMALVMVALAVASVPISMVNLLHKLDVLSLLSGADHLRALPMDQLQARVMLSLDAYGNGMLVSQVFWGLWLLPFGLLVFRSGFLPRVFGVLLVLGCLGYLTSFFGGLLAPEYPGSTLARFARLPAAFGEIGICLWLLIMGTGKPTANPAIGAQAS